MLVRSISEALVHLGENNDDFVLLVCRYHVVIYKLVI